MERELIEIDPKDHVYQYEIADGEHIDEALIEAFEQAEVDEFDESAVVLDWVEPEALDLLFRHTAGHPQVVVRLWDHPVLITRDTVTIHRPTS